MKEPCFRSWQKEFMHVFVSGADSAMASELVRALVGLTPVWRIVLLSQSVVEWVPDFEKDKIRQREREKMGSALTKADPSELRTSISPPTTVGKSVNNLRRPNAKCKLWAQFRIEKRTYRPPSLDTKKAGAARHAVSCMTWNTNFISDVVQVLITGSS